MFSANTHAMVIDANDNIRMAIYRMFLETGVANVYQAKSMNEARKILTTKKLDIIVMEWDLKVMTGAELIAEIRQEGESKNAALLVCSASINKEMVAQAIRAGASEILAKPFNYKLFKEKVYKAIKLPLTKRFKQRVITTDGVQDLPQKADSVPEAYEEKTIQPVATTPTVLVVDDEISNIEIVSKSLKSFCNVKFANSGKKALELCQRAAPDLLLLDIMMPEMDGYQVLKILKSRVDLADIPVIFLTAKATDEDIVRGLTLGAVDYIVKPFNSVVLKLRVKNHLSLAQTTKKADEQLQTLIEERHLKENADRVVFNYMLSPLKQIKTATERIGGRSLTTKQLQSEADFIKYALRNLSQVIESINTILRLEDSGFRLKLTPVKIRAIIDEIIRDYAKDQHAKSLQIDNYIGHDTVILADDIHMKTLFTELYGNAIEGAPRGSRVAFFESISKEKVELTVFNPGEVPHDVKDNFFEKYYTVGKQFGTGLGTYVSKLICDACGSDISLSSSDNETRIIMEFNRPSPD